MYLFAPNIYIVATFQIKTLESEKEMMLTNNKSVAEYNLGIEPKLVQAKEQLAYSYEEAVKYQKEYDLVKQKLG